MELVQGLNLNRQYISWLEPEMPVTYSSRINIKIASSNLWDLFVDHSETHTSSYVALIYEHNIMDIMVRSYSSVHGNKQSSIHTLASLQ